jgi:hypothetical protein
VFHIRCGLIIGSKIRHSTLEAIEAKSENVISDKVKTTDDIAMEKVYRIFKEYHLAFRFDKFFYCNRLCQLGEQNVTNA